MRNVIATTFAAAVFSLFAAAACANSEDIGGDTSPTLPEPDGGQAMGDPPTRTDPSASSGNDSGTSGSQSNTTDAGGGSKDSGSGGSTGTDSGGGGSTGTDSGGGGGGGGGPVCDTSSLGNAAKYSAFYSLYSPILPGCPCDPSTDCCYDDGKNPPKCLPNSL